MPANQREGIIAVDHKYELRSLLPRSTPPLNKRLESRWLVVAYDDVARGDIDTFFENTSSDHQVPLSRF